MKKITLIFVMVCLSAILSAQNTFKYEVQAKGGLSVGLNGTKVDSVKVISHKHYMFEEADTLIPYVPVSGQINGSTLYAPKYILDTLLVTDATYQLVLADAGRTIHVYRATSVKITVPPAGTVNFPVGTVINFEMAGAGIVRFIKGAGVTFESQKDSVCINTRYGWATLRKRAADKWSLFGAILD